MGTRCNVCGSNVSDFQLRMRRARFCSMRCSLIDQVKGNFGVMILFLILGIGSLILFRVIYGEDFVDDYGLLLGLITSGIFFLFSLVQRSELLDLVLLHSFSSVFTSTSCGNSIIFSNSVLSVKSLI